ncbi:MAG: hypothetical protein MUD00_02010 [Candidatus Pacebacteria bacterium]|nr:hypothetical protein [Candidatus Paceibacterota bacterium]
MAIYTTEGRGLSVCIILVLAIGAFGLGRLSKTSSEGNGILLRYSDEKIQNTVETWDTTQSKENRQNISSAMHTSALFASKNGTKYYTNACSGALRIKEENKIFFGSEAEAREAGYEKSATCK